MDVEAAEMARRVRACLRAIETGDGDTLAAIYAPDAVQVEMPNRWKPQGDKRGIEALLADLERGKALLSSQSYEVRKLVATGATVAVEVLWTGVLAVALGALRAGDSVRAHSAMFFEFRDGRIVRQHNYDCFANSPAEA